MIKPIMGLFTVGAAVAVTGADIHDQALDGATHAWSQVPALVVAALLLGWWAWMDYKRGKAESAERMKLEERMLDLLAETRQHRCPMAKLDKDD